MASTASKARAGNDEADAFQQLVADTMRQWTQAQVVPLDAWLAWTRAFAAWQQEMWDEWAVRFAGGAPIDV